MIRRLVERSFRAMGTSCTVAVTVRPGLGKAAARALARAESEVAACETALSRFDPRSDLSRLNAASGSWLEVDERLVLAVRAALRAREETGGRFDPTILPALVAAGYDRTFDELAVRPAREADGWRAGAELEADPDRRRARIEAGAALDLGGIGKGLAAERALDAMLSSRPELDGGFVDLGGDIAVRGTPPDGTLWRIGIADPRRPGAMLGTIGLFEGGVATSGRDRRRFGPGRSLHHLIDPATGAPADEGPLTVTVVGHDPAQAEAHATALAISTLEDAREHLDGFPSLSALFVPAAGEPVPIGGLVFADAA
jgi:thiamine biosynthesis lipoprotein